MAYFYPSIHKIHQNEHVANEPYYRCFQRKTQFICIWFFTAVPLLIMTSAYAILWWSGDIFNEQLTFSVAEFLMSLAINGPCFLVVLMYYLRITGALRSEAMLPEGEGKRPKSPYLPPDLPDWYAHMPEAPPYEMRRKLVRRQRQTGTSPLPRRAYSQVGAIF